MIFTVSKRDGYLVIWPRYFDSNITRKAGRRISVIYSISSPTAGDLALICKYVKLTPHLDEKGSHPSLPWDECGRVLVRRPTIRGKKISKQKLIRILGKRLKTWYDNTPKKTRMIEVRKYLENVKRLEG